MTVDATSSPVAAVTESTGACYLVMCAHRSGSCWLRSTTSTYSSMHTCYGTTFCGTEVRTTLAQAMVGLHVITGKPLQICAERLISRLPNGARHTLRTCVRIHKALLIRTPAIALYNYSQDLTKKRCRHADMCRQVHFMRGSRLASELFSRGLALAQLAS